MMDEPDIKGTYYLKNNYNYPSKVTVVCDTKEVVLYKMNHSCLRFLSNDMKLRCLDYFKHEK